MTQLKKCILHIEDDPDIQSYVKSMLDGIASVTSADGQRDARQLLIGSVFDLFILDLVLKDASGASIATDLKSIYPDTPIIILSAHNVADAIEEAEATFVKGKLDESSFVATVEKLLA